MTDNDFHARRTELANACAGAAAEWLDYMGCAGALAAIPNTQQYVVAGDIAAIRSQLDTVAPQRRMRHGGRPELDLYFGPEAGQARRWAALITSAGHGILQEYGTPFEHAQPGQEVLEVMEILPGAANNAAEEGELLIEARRWAGDATTYAAKLVRSLADALDLVFSQVDNKAEVEPVAFMTSDKKMLVFADAMHKLQFDPAGMIALYEYPPATTGEANASPIGASTVLTDERSQFEAFMRKEGRIHESSLGHGAVFMDEGKAEIPWRAWQERARVAAQAGQVAVPERDMKIAVAVAEDVFRKYGYVLDNARLAEIINEVSPAKESK